MGRILVDPIPETYASIAAYNADVPARFAAGFTHFGSPIYDSVTGNVYVQWVPPANP